jgi:ribosomal protein S18 acetylase RimI-like enzyme
MDVTIRTATEDDDEALAALARDSWSADTTPTPQEVEYRPFFANGATPGDVIVAARDGTLVGYVLTGGGFPIASHAHVAHLRGLAVAPSAQRIGLGRRLVERALGELATRGASRVRSRVLSTNAASLAVHAACGFVEEGRLHGEFIIDGIGPVDDVLLAYRFDDPAPPARP